MSEKELIIILVYFLFVVFIGIFPGRKSGKEVFLISGRNLGGFSNGLSIAASKIGGGLLVTYSTLVFTFGMGAFYIFVG